MLNPHTAMRLPVTSPAAILIYSLNSPLSNPGLLQGGRLMGVLLLGPPALSPWSQERFCSLLSSLFASQLRRKEARLAGFDTCSSGQLSSLIARGGTWAQCCSFPWQSPPEVRVETASFSLSAHFLRQQKGEECGAGEIWESRIPGLHPSIWGDGLCPVSPLMPGNFTHLEP